LRRIIGALAAANVLLAVAWLVGFGPPTVSRPDPITVPGEGFVALGDSYSAGEGLNPYLRGTQNTAFRGNRCHRSRDAYGAVLAGGPDTERFTFRACSGAVIAHILDTSQLHEGVDVGGPQLHDVNDAGLVTITIGGNDALFADIVQFCALRMKCLDTPKWHRDGSLNLRAWANARVPQISDDLRTLFGELSAALPRARVIVLGYPRLFSLHPKSGGQRSCLAYGLFSDNERRGLRALGDRLNTEIADIARSSGFEYIHVADAFDGHETCGPKGQWLQFFRVDPENLTTKDIFDAGNFHPTTDGQAMLARLVACYLDRYPTKQPQATETGRTGDAVHRCAT
jgi:lysophospholipase L1-like esterase